ncbi:hypothetical protein LZ30DRAFT_192123 [Colletotrichum cereale]|nr:hypothetical protein LZ30DRAFT_192123 [Colletotrichum cereale]
MHNTALMVLLRHPFKLPPTWGLIWGLSRIATNISLSTFQGLVEDRFRRRSSYPTVVQLSGSLHSPVSCCSANAVYRAYSILGRQASKKQPTFGGAAFVDDPVSKITWGPSSLERAKGPSPAALAEAVGLPLPAVLRQCDQCQRRDGRERERSQSLHSASGD